ncbi:MAG: polymer-forming cytoskeletal protein [Pseudomonadota bacterium]
MSGQSILQSIEQKDIIAVLGRGSEFEGKLTFEGALRIDGKFSGEIFSDGTLIVGDGAVVKAEVSVASVVIQGQLIGNIKAPNCLELHSSAHLVGNIFTPTLSVEKGAVFEGNSVMESGRKAPREALPAPPPVPSSHA